MIDKFPIMFIVYVLRIKYKQNYAIKLKVKKIWAILISVIYELSTAELRHF